MKNLMLDDLSLCSSPRFKAEHSSWMYYTFTLKIIWWQLQFLGHWLSTSGVLWGTSASHSKLAGVPQIIPVSYLTIPWGGIPVWHLTWLQGYLHGTTFLPWLDVNWCIFIAWTCGWREEISSGWHQTHSGPQSMRLWCQIFLFHTRNVRVCHASEGWTLTVEMRALSLTYKNAPELRVQNPTKSALFMSIILLLIIFTCTKTPQKKN